MMSHEHVLKSKCQHQNTGNLPASCTNRFLNLVFLTGARQQQQKCRVLKAVPVWKKCITVQVRNRPKIMVTCC